MHLSLNLLLLITEMLVKGMLVTLQELLRNNLSFIMELCELKMG